MAIKREICRTEIIILRKRCDRIGICSDLEDL